MNRHVLSLFTAIFSLAASAAVPLRWTVETSRVTPATFDAIHGETLALEAAFQSYGKPLQMPSDGCCILWQTNGMGSAWWQFPATVASNRVSATFAPAMDPGAASVTGFLGATGENYRAAFTLRFRHGPGGNPSALPLPTPAIDFATVAVLNPSNAPFAMSNELYFVTTNLEAMIVAETNRAATAQSAISHTFSTDLSNPNDNIYFKVFTIRSLECGNSVSAYWLPKILGSSDVWSYLPEGANTVKASSGREINVNVHYYEQAGEMYVQVGIDEPEEAWLFDSRGKPGKTINMTVGESVRNIVKAMQPGIVSDRVEVSQELRTAAIITNAVITEVSTNYIAAERLRAQLAEADLAAMIVAETNRAQLAETDLAAMIVAETNRAQIAEADLAAMIVAETNRAQVAETALVASVNIKIDAATATNIAASASVTNAGAVAAAKAYSEVFREKTDLKTYSMEWGDFVYSRGVTNARNIRWIGDDNVWFADYTDTFYGRTQIAFSEQPSNSTSLVFTCYDYGTAFTTRLVKVADGGSIATSNMVNGIVAPATNATLAAATNYTDAATNAALAAANAYTDAKVSGGSRYPRLVWSGHTPYVEDIIDRGGDNISASLNLVRDVVLFTADEDNTRITIVSNTYDTVKSLPSVSLSYSRDYVMFPDVNASTWSPMSVSPESSDVITLQSGESVAIRCPTENTTLFGYCFSIISGSARVSGELMALASASVPDYFNSTNQFYSMFSHCANLSSAKGLNIAATNTLPYCMAGLFSHCFDLRYPPRELKPKIIAQRAYTSMFSWCTNLVEAPLIMAESAIGERAMWLMFYNCKHLESVSIRHLTSYTGSNSLRAFLSMDNVSDDNRLNHVEVGFSSWTSQAAYFLETTAVTNGVFVCPSALGTQRATSSNSWRGAPVGWSIVNF